MRNLSPETEETKNVILQVIVMIVALFFLLCVFSFRSETDYSVAHAEQEEGLYIFYRSKPTTAYDYLATYKIPVMGVMKEKPEVMVNKLVKEVRKQYPKADAIIVSPDMWKCDVVLFKK